MNTTNTDAGQYDPNSAILSLTSVIITLIPLIISEILPFLPIPENGILHSILIACARLKTRDRIIAPRGG